VRAVGIIPARGGSKGLPGKHLLALGGRPLITWTFDAAQAAGSLAQVIVSTDDAAVAAAARAAGIDVPFDRPASLATDDTPMLDVLVHAVQELDRAHDRAEIIVLLQPTSPFRTADHIDAAVTLLAQSGADSVVSVIAVPHRFVPESLMRLDGEQLTPYAGQIGVTRRQDKPLLYARNGPAVLAVRRDVLLDQHSLYGRHIRPLVMADAESIDIDTAHDLALAELLLSRR
jgi:CMP-N,N'-diacetyllegionaminic acid synthase